MSIIRSLDVELDMFMQQFHSQEYLLSLQVFFFF